VLDPLISVIVPTYNRGALLRAAVESVRKQTLPGWELIVVDDGSTDGTVEWLRRLDDPRIRPILLARCANPGRVRNLGLREARGRMVAFLDSDDLWDACKLEIQLGRMQSMPDVGWSYTRFGHIDENGRPIDPLVPVPDIAPSGWILERLVETQALAMIQTVMVERALLDRVGGFDEQPAFREDYDLLLRLAEAGPACGLAERLTAVRHHPLRTTFGVPEVRRWTVRAYLKLYGRTGDARLRAMIRARCAAELISLALAYRAAGRTGRALGAMAEAFRYRPFPPGWVRALALIILTPITPPILRAVWRRLSARLTS
jgi:glycosyltransferase involved in cell wall biosynthesis